MKIIIKKVCAAVLAVILAATLTGCDKGYLMTVDGMDIRNGIYLSFLSMAYSSAGDALAAEKTDEDSSITDEDKTPITEKTIQGVDGSTWIKSETLKAVRRFVAIQRTCEQLGIILTDEDIKEVNSKITSEWEEENVYLQYIYGFSTMGEYYESQGIGQESMREILRVNKLQDKLFLYYFDKGGEFEVSDSEILDYLKENYATVKMQSFSYTDAEGKKLEKDEDKKAIKDEAQAYADRINNGEKPIDVFYEYNLKTAKESVKAKAEKEYKEDNEDGLTKDEWIEKEIEALGIKKAEKEEDLDRFLSKEGSSFDEKTTEYIFNAASDGKATVFEVENGVYIIIKSDITTKTSWIEDNHDNILNEIKGEDFRNMMDLFGQNYEVVADDSLVNKKYAPETLN